jgi:hypothetical protein
LLALLEKGACLILFSFDLFPRIWSDFENGLDQEMAAPSIRISFYLVQLPEGGRVRATWGGRIEFTLILLLVMPLGHSRVYYSTVQFLTRA